MRKKLAVHSVAVAVIIVCLAGAGRSDTPENPGPEEAVFEMREVSAFDEFVANPGIHLTRGTYAECSTVPDKDVKAYPKLNSKQPLYGKVVFDPSLWRGKSPLVFHFVLDESGDTATKEEQTAEKKPETSLLDRLAEKLSVLADEGAQWKKSPKKKAKHAPFDRLYVDLNRDLDLSNDPVLKPTADPPWHALPDWDINERVAYDCLNIDVDFGPRTGERPFRILPWFSSSEQGGRTYNMMHFVAVTARRGMVRVGKYEFDVLMAQPYVVTGRFDRTTTTLHWTPKKPRGEAFLSGVSAGEHRYNVAMRGGTLYDSRHANGRSRDREAVSRRVRDPQDRAGRQGHQGLQPPRFAHNG